jgi:TolB-like protein/Flp pilus assembly protein TadD
MPLAPASRLGPYEILELLSAGGMGEIYRARDTRLGREIAVKVLPPAFARDRVRVARFEKEARTAGLLNHPNIVSVHDVGVHDGISFVVSELVDGFTLRTAMRDGPVPVARASAWVAQIARGLAAAHQHGVVHRDVKPENVMLTRDGRVKILDFGVAKLESPLTGAEGDTVETGSYTAPGTLLGTIAYMSPEQVRGEPVDQRTDIFSLGVLLYELLAGRHPFSRGSAADTLSAILRDAPPALSAIPAGLDLVLRRSLDKSREARFQSAGDMADALETVARPGPGVSALPPSPPGAGETVRTIAVLPFANMSREMESDYFSDGLTEELIHALTRVRGLQVVAWHSASQLKGQESDARAILGSMNVETALAGSVRRAEGRVRIAARLVDVATGYYLWSETYDRRLEDVFAIQEEIAAAIVGRLTAALLPAATKGRRTGNVDAFQLYLRGRYLWNKRTDEGLRQSVPCFERAVEIDPEFALGYAGLADAYLLLTDYGIVHPAEAMPRARIAASRALELDPRSSEAHTSLAFIRSNYEWQWLEAEALYRRAIELGPGNATAHHWLAVDLLALLGRFAQAEQELAIALQLDPLSLIVQEGRGYLLAMSRRYDEAIDAYRAIAELEPSFYKAYSSTGRALSLKGEYGDAIDMLEKARSLAGEVPNIIGALGQTYGFAGRSAEARALLDELRALALRRHVPSTTFALVHTGLGEHDQALDWLEKGCDQRELSVVALKVHPAYDALRDDPRFAELLRRMRLDGELTTLTAG